MHLLPSNLASLAALCADEWARYSVPGVQVSFATNGDYTAVATDGKYLGIVTGPGRSAGQYPATASMSAAPNTATSVVIPQDEWAAAFKALPKSKRDKPVREICANYLVCVPATETTYLASTDGMRETGATVVNAEGRFPAYDTAIPHETDRAASVDLSPRLLRKLLQVAERFTDADRITLSIYSPGEPITIRATNVSGQTFTGALMTLP